MRTLTKVKKNHVFCSICMKHIEKGLNALFVMRKGKMVATYCEDCSYK